MKIDGVFSGGGVKAYGFIGAMQSLVERNLTLARVAGTSAGAIIASFLAAGYQPEKMKKMFNELDLKQFLHPPKLSTIIPFSKWLFLYFQMGLYQGDKFEAWLHEKLAKKSIHTFHDLRDGYLKVVVRDRKSTRLNSSHVSMSYAVFCVKKKRRWFVRCARLSIEVGGQSGIPGGPIRGWARAVSARRACHTSLVERLE